MTNEEAAVEYTILKRQWLRDQQIADALEDRAELAEDDGYKELRRAAEFIRKGELP